VLYREVCRDANCQLEIDSSAGNADTKIMKRTVIFSTLFALFLLTELSALETGIASYYAGKFQGRLTANGEIFDTMRYTAAHKTLPFNTIVKVINKANGKHIVVRINDRGPFVTGRIIDLSRAAAEAIDMVGSGLADVSVEIVKPGDGKTYHRSGPPTSTIDIQIGAFGNSDNAVQAKTILEENGFDVHLEVLPSGITRVIIAGVFIEDLVSAKIQLGSIGYSDVLIRANSQVR
jgi:rare lipoprotein A